MSKESPEKAIDIKELVTYSVTDIALEQYRNEFLPLTVKGIDDYEGYEKVREARLFIKGERVNVEKRRVELKAQSLEYGRAVDAEARRITLAIEEVESHLMAEQKKVDDEVARIKFEKEQRVKLPERQEQLSGIGANVPDEMLLRLTDETFATLFNSLNAERLEKQRVEQEEKDRALRAEAERIEAEKKAIEDRRLADELEKKHQAEVEQARKEAVEQARMQAELDAERKEDERIEAERVAKVEAERIEAERPDKEKLVRFANVFTAIDFPEVTSKKAVVKLEKVRKLIEGIVDELMAA